VENLARGTKALLLTFVVIPICPAAIGRGELSHLVADRGKRPVLHAHGKAKRHHKEAEPVRTQEKSPRTYGKSETGSGEESVNPPLGNPVS